MIIRIRPLSSVKLHLNRNVPIHKMTHCPPQHPSTADVSSVLFSLFLLAPLLFPPPIISRVSEWSSAEFILPDLPSPDRTLLDLYRATMVVGDMGRVGLTLIWYVPPSCPITQPILPNPHLPRENLADSGRTKIMVNPIHVPDHHCHHVLSRI